MDVGRGGGGRKKGEGEEESRKEDEGGDGGGGGGGGRKKNSEGTAAALCFLDKYKLIRSSNAYAHLLTCKPFNFRNTNAPRRKTKTEKGTSS